MALHALEDLKRENEQLRNENDGLKTLLHDHGIALPTEIQ